MHSRQRPWGRIALIALAGGCAALGQAPWGLWPLTFGAVAVLLVLTAKARTVWQGFGVLWGGGTAQFALALSWVFEPFLVEPEVTGWMAPFALAFLAGGLGLFWGGAGAAAVMLRRGAVARVWVAALLLLGGEALRGVVFTGFPWTLSGHVLIGTPLDQLAALGGPLALSALVLGGAAAGATMALRGLRARAMIAPLGALGAIGAVWIWGGHRVAQPLPVSRPVTVRLVQANVPQHLKWERDLIEGFFLRHVDLSRSDDDAPADLVLWPETAAPFFLDRPGPALRMTAEASGAPVIMGLQRRDGASGVLEYFNSLAVIDAAGTPVATYDKHHLVPFGEYIPVLGAMAARLGLSGLAAQTLSGYVAGPGPVVLDLDSLVPGAGRVLPLICYEAVFSRNLRVAPRPDWILQATNDAWFGARSGPFQHLAQAQLRAIETGLPVVRVANTGVSAVIDARGRIGPQLGVGETGALQAAIPGALPPTLYARWGDTPWFVLIGGLLSLLVLRAPKRVDLAMKTR